MANCGQACPYNTLDGCKVKEHNAICPLTNMATPITEYRMTNADRIRAMSDEELAAFMFSMVDCVSCQNKLMNNGKLVFGADRKTCTDKDYYAMCDGDGRKCESVCLEWLKQHADDANPFHYEKGCQPHGAEQFAKACAVCVNIGSDLCRDCKAEKKSGFEPPF